MGKKPRIKEYHEPAGGWGAAKATAAVLLEQQVLFKGAAALLLDEQARWLQMPELRVA